MQPFLLLSSAAISTYRPPFLLASFIKAKHVQAFNRFDLCFEENPVIAPQGHGHNLSHVFFLLVTSKMKPIHFFPNSLNLMFLFYFLCTAQSTYRNCSHSDHAGPEVSSNQITPGCSVDASSNSPTGMKTKALNPISPSSSSSSLTTANKKLTLQTAAKANYFPDTLILYFFRLQPKSVSVCFHSN